MKHANRLIARILFPEGRRNLQDLSKHLIGENVSETLKCELKTEHIGHPLLKEAITQSEKVGAYVTRKLFETILEGEGEHIYWRETQLGLIEKVGLQNYRQSQI